MEVWEDRAVGRYMLCDDGARRRHNSAESNAVCVRGDSGRERAQAMGARWQHGDGLGA